jgi:hypothetical protein
MTKHRNQSIGLNDKKTISFAPGPGDYDIDSVVGDIDYHNWNIKTLPSNNVKKWCPLQWLPLKISDTISSF